MAQNEITYFPCEDFGHSGLIIGRVADFAVIAGGYSGKGTLPRECWRMTVDAPFGDHPGVSIEMWMPDRYREAWEAADARGRLTGWLEQSSPGGTTYWHTEIAVRDAPKIVRLIIRSLFSAVERQEREERERNEAEARFRVNNAQHVAFAGVNWENNEAMTIFRDMWRQYDWSFG